ncbi:17595_t:CDS:2, partial [Funneliformis geosporum]
FSQKYIVTPEYILSCVQKYRRSTYESPPKNGTLNTNGVKKRYYAFLNKIIDHNFHPIPFIAAGPGTGKTRVLEESLNMMQQCAENDSDSDLKELVNNAVLIYVTYGNASAASLTDRNIGGEISLSLRILHQYFVEGSHLNFCDFVMIIQNTFLNIADFNLNRVLSTIILDINKKKVMIINCIDEINKIYELDNSTFKDMVNAIGSHCCTSNDSMFYVPFLAGTIYKPLHQIVTKSMHPPLPIPLPLLGIDHMLEIGRRLQFPVDTNYHFHRYLGDVSGHCRTLEFFYQQCSDFIVNTIDFLQVMTDVRILLSERYTFEEFVHDNSDIIAGCLLDEAMILNDRIKELKQYGIVILEEDYNQSKRVYLRLPYIML